MSRHRGTTLYVRNISDRVRYDDLKRLFQKYGRVVDVTIPLDYYSGMPKGFCFVEFEDQRDAQEAKYRMDRQRLFGREIEVEFAKGIRKTPGEMRTRDHRPVGRRDDRRSRSRSPYHRGGSRDRDRRDGRRDDRGGRRERSRGRDGGERERRGGSYSRSRSYSRNRTPSPKDGRSQSRDRSRSRDRGMAASNGGTSNADRSMSPRRGSPRRSRSPSQ